MEPFIIFVCIVIGIGFVVATIKPFARRAKRRGFGRRRINRPRRQYYSQESAEERGAMGENEIKQAIGDTIPGQQYVINNLILSVGEGQSSQIDHVVINPNGVFVIETKNYSGRIYGGEKQQYWTQTLAYGHEKHRFYNPLKQNATHIYRIKQLLPKGTPITGAVVFAQENLEYIEAPGVYNILTLLNLLNNPRTPQLTAVQMEQIFQTLSNCKAQQISDEEHVQNVYRQQDMLAFNICPRCGAKLVQRQGKYGTFWGCSKYPQCKFIRKD